jgi:tetratricopeptide (TPR) repeat protein
MLETIREFGLERLEASEDMATVQGGYATYFQALAQAARDGLDGSEQGTWLAQVEAELDNLRAVLAWALPHAPEDGALLAANLAGFWAARGLLSEGREWLDRILAQRALLSVPVLRRVVHAAGMMAGLQGDTDRSRILAEESLALSRQLGDDRAIASALNNLAASVMETGDFASAETLFGEALTLYQRLGNTAGTAQVTFNLGNIDAFRGEVEQALARYAEALEVYRRLGDRLSEAQVLHNIGMTELIDNDDPVRGATLLAEALLIYVAFEIPLEQGYCVFGLSGAFALLSQAHAAARLGGAAEAQRECLDVPLFSLFVPYHRRFVEAIQEQLGEEAAEAAWAAGRALTLEEAVAEALALADKLVNETEA